MFAGVTTYARLTYAVIAAEVDCLDDGVNEDALNQEGRCYLFGVHVFYRTVQRAAAQQASAVLMSVLSTPLAVLVVSANVLLVHRPR